MGAQGRTKLSPRTQLLRAGWRGPGETGAPAKGLCAAEGGHRRRPAALLPEGGAALRVDVTHSRGGAGAVARHDRARLSVV